MDTVTVHPAQVTDTLSLPARLMANPTDVVHIYPPLSGRVLALKVLPGQEVSKGQAIGTLQSNDAASARSDFEKAKIEAARADLQLQRGKELLQHEVMAQKDYDDLKALDDADHAELERTRQTLHILGFSENDTSADLPIRSPISGVVLDVGTAPGELQRSLDNANAIATIANIDSIWVVGDLYPSDVDAVRRGQSVEVRVNGYPNEVRTAPSTTFLTLSIPLRSHSKFVSSSLIPDTNSNLRCMQPFQLQISSARRLSFPPRLSSVTGLRTSSSWPHPATSTRGVT